MFSKNKQGIWDSSGCTECCSDCSSYCGEDCPLELEGTCDNCIFKNGFKKCENCLNSEAVNCNFCDECYDLL